MADPFIGEIRPFAFTFAPYGWATCDGQDMSIMQNQALYAVIGLNYGGDGTRYFSLPNLQGCAPMAYGAGPGLNPWKLGQALGEEIVNLRPNNYPSHTHALNVVSNTNADQDVAADHYFAKGGAAGRPFTAVATYQSQPSTNSPLAADAVEPAGMPLAEIPHENMQPYLPVLLCIALEGDFPVRP